MRLKFLGAAGAALLMLAGPAGAQPIRVDVNGQRVHFPYAQPIEIDGRVMIPLRGVLDRLGAERIDWRPVSQEVVVAGPGENMRLRIGDQMALVNGQRVALDVPPMIVQGTTMVPLRFVSENLGARVDWLDSTQTVYIATPNERIAGSREEYSSSREEDGEPLPPRRQRPYREPGLRSEYITALSPRPGATAADPRAEIFARFRPGAPIDYNTVRLTLNGHNITPDSEITSEGVRYLPLDDYRRGHNDVRLTFRDTSGLLTTEEWDFFAP
jgi:hypothetical protein